MITYDVNYITEVKGADAFQITSSIVHHHGKHDEAEYTDLIGKQYDDGYRGTAKFLTYSSESDYVGSDYVIRDTGSGYAIYSFGKRYKKGSAHRP